LNLGELLIQSLPLRIVQSSIAGLNRKLSTTVNQIRNPGKRAISYARKICTCFDIAYNLGE
jgi:hypothetical protein